jgi:hypothetical protein|tara:strand:+ start:86 stop:295 length:210 start_codon:yes stop_codon:yes gene_type:complete
MSRKITMCETNQDGIYCIIKLLNVPPGTIIDGGLINFNERYNEDNLRTLFEQCPKMQIDMEVVCQSNIK